MRLFTGRLTIVAFVATLFATFSAPAGASFAAMSGSVSCTVSGNGVLKPVISNTPTTKPLHITGSATASSCDHSGVSGGKGLITSASVKFSLLDDDTGYTCQNYDLGFSKSKLEVKWQGPNRAGHLHTVGSDKTTVSTFQVVSTSPVTYKIVSAPVARGDFKGSTITLITELDVSLDALLAQCNGSGIGPFGFGHVNASTVSVP
jgi:hypothetical protein